MKNKLKRCSEISLIVIARELDALQLISRHNESGFYQVIYKGYVFFAITYREALLQAIEDKLTR